MAYQSHSRLINRTHGATGKERGATPPGSCTHGDAAETCAKGLVRFLVLHWRLALSCQGRRGKPSNDAVCSGPKEAQSTQLCTGENIARTVQM